jgi:hypothetical protein
MVTVTGGFFPAPNFSAISSGTRMPVLLPMCNRRLKRLFHFIVHVSKINFIFRDETPRLIFAGNVRLKIILPTVISIALSAACLI